MKRTLATVGVMGLGLLSLTAPAIAASDHVVVCHWNGTTLTQMGFDNNGAGGHAQHSQDIIPPTTKLPAGLNWNNAGKIRYVNECGAALPPGEVIDPVNPPVTPPVVTPPAVEPPVVVDPPVTPPVTPPVVTPPVGEPPVVDNPPATPPVTPPVVTPPAEEQPVVVDKPVGEPPVVVDNSVVNPPAAVPEAPAAVVPAAAPAQPAPAKQAAAAPKAAPQAPAQAPVSVGTNQGYNAQTAVGASETGPGWLAGLGALAAAGAVVAVRRRTRPVDAAR